MKRTIIFSILALMLAAGCTEKNLYPVAYINEAEGSTFTPAEVSAKGGDVTINFSTNYTWQIKGYSTLGFCSVNAIKGESGNGSIVVTVEPNTTSAVRTATFDIVAGAARKTVTITQTETNALNIGTTSYNTTANGGLVEIAVSSNIEYTVNIPSEITWVREIPQSKVMETSYINLQVDPYTEWMPRTASGITVTGKDVSGNDITHNITITQEGGGTTTLWTKAFETDLSQIGTAAPFHVAMYNNQLYMADGTNIHAIDPATGNYVEQVTIEGLTAAPQSMANDDAGNLLVAANATGTTFTVYVYDGNSVSELLSYNAANIAGGTLGNLRVVGDVKTKAVVTVVAAPQYFVAWQIENGAVSGSPVVRNIHWNTPSTGINAVYYGVVSPVSDALSDGLLYVGYSGEPYNLYYTDTPSTVENETWKTACSPDINGNMNPNSLSIAEYNGKKYCAIGIDGHFTWSTCGVKVLDITDLSNVSVVYETTFAGTFSLAGASDVKLVSEDGVLHLYVAHAGFGVATCVELSN